MLTDRDSQGHQIGLCGTVSFFNYSREYIFYIWVEMCCFFSKIVCIRSESVKEDENFEMNFKYVRSVLFQDILRNNEYLIPVLKFSSNNWGNSKTKPAFCVTTELFKCFETARVSLHIVFTVDYLSFTRTSLIKFSSESNRG